MKEKIKSLIQESLKELDLESFQNTFDVGHPDRLDFGDYSSNIGLKLGPIPASRDIVKWLNKHLPPEIERVEENFAFINFHLSKEFFKNSIQEIIDNEKFGTGKHAQDFKVLVEHTQPNPFKAFHIGHFMNNAIGESVARIVEANGAEVKTASYHGDVGMHVAKAVWAGGDYAKGAKAFEESEEAKVEIQEINKKIYDKSDEGINKQYEEGKKKSIEEFEQIYERLGSKFDFRFFESETGEVGKSIVLENVGKVFEEGEGGATIFKGENFGLHTRVFLNSDGLPTYEAKEVGLADIKKGKYSFDQALTITANEQDAFFNVTEVAIGEVFPELKGKLKHLSHGMLRLPTGKMSSRTGDVITAEALIDTVKEKTKGDEQVAIGAIKYMILRQAIGGDIVFDIDKSVSTEGDSGVYLQYAHARSCAVLAKAGDKGDTNSPRETTHEIERLLYRFPEVVERAGQEYAPHHITTYLTELAGSFNNFYAHNPIIGSPEESYLLAITGAFNRVMKNGLHLLAIPAPERM